MLTDKKYISIRFDEDKLKGRNRVLSILQEISNLLSSSPDINELFKGALALVLENFNLEAGRIYLMEDEREQLYLAAHQGIDPAGLKKMDLDEGFSGKAARTKSFIAQYVTELENQNRAVLLKSKGFNIVICVPLITMNRVVGVMNLATGRSIGLDQNEVDLLTVVANRIAVAIENARLYEDLREKLQHLKEKKEMIKFFAYSIVHDLKSPAIGIHGFSRRLKEKYGRNLDEKGKKYCEEIIKLAEHMVILLEEINSYIATKELQPYFEVVRLKEITAAIRSEFAARLKLHNTELLLPTSNPEIIADRILLLRAFRNLVDNALKYGGDNLRRISIDYAWNEAFHILSVSDDGIGITPENREKMFDAFQRNHTSQRAMGSGLGLAIVREVARKHGGSAWIRYSAILGTSFYISIAKDLNVTAQYTASLEENPKVSVPI